MGAMIQGANALGSLVQTRANDGGLRVGEMERDALIAHGASAMLRERLFTLSDYFTVSVCRKCGLIGYNSSHNKERFCTKCKGSGEMAQIELPYASKLLFQELMAVGIAPRIQLEN
jgi:DNA-directed RNA polymerase beta subunit